MSEMIYCGKSTCHGHGEYAICGEVYYHDVYQCDSCRAKQKEKIVEELERKLAESQREFRAADATIDNLQMQVEKLAAENAVLKSCVDGWCDMPATDAFLAEVRAQGVERLANAWYAIANETDPGISISDSSRLKYRQRADDAADFANEIRQDAAR